MKRFLMLSLTLCMLLSLCLLPVSAVETTMELVEEEWWDDTDHESYDIKFYDAEGNPHIHDVCMLPGANDMKDGIDAFTWFSGSHLYGSSGHFAHVGSYVEVTVPNCVKFTWATQYRGPEDGYSTSATIYVDGEEVATVGPDKLNGENLTDNFDIWVSPEYDGKSTKVFKIVNTAPFNPDALGFEGTEEDWVGFNMRLPFDLFKVSYYYAEEVEESEEQTTVPEESEPAPSATEPEDSAPATTGTEDKKEGCGGTVGTLALLSCVALAGAACARKRR